MKDIRWKLAIAALFLPLSTSCVSQQYVADLETEIAALREERTDLKKQLRSMGSDLDSTQIALADASAELERMPEMLDYPELDDVGVGYGIRGGNTVLTLPAEITFGSGSADISESGARALRVVASTLQRDYGTGVYWIEGHTDSDPIRKSKYPSNRALSVDRAMQVLHYLVEECGVLDEQCVVAGHGQYQPIAPNEGDAKARNRRVEIVVHTAEG